MNMKNLNKFLGGLTVAFVLLTACSKENEPITIQAADEKIEKKGLLLEGSQEVPEVKCKASGTMDVSYNKTTKMLTYSITWKSLTNVPVGAHIHGDAPRGFNAPVKHNFTALIPKTVDGTITNSVLVDEVAIKEKDLLAGLYYVNIHTATNPSGEIRGQIEFEKPDVVMKKGLLLEGKQESPAKKGLACGTADVSYNKTAKVLVYAITWHSLTGNPTGSHIHGEALRGFNAPVVHDFFQLIPKTAQGTFTNWVKVDEIAIKEAGLLNGQYYFNLHTSDNPGGEIRGQIEF